MKRRRPLDDLLGTKTGVRVLRTLARYPQREFTGRELAQEAGVDPSKANAFLARLAENRLVHQRGAGRATLWRLTEGHLLGAPLVHVFDIESRLMEMLSQTISREVARVPGVEKAVLFGSVARGEDRPSSDVDLLVVVRQEVDVEDTRRHLRPVRELVLGTFGHPPNFIIYSEDEARRKRNLPLMRNIERDGIVVFGEDPMRTEDIDPRRAGIYLRKAHEFLAGMKRSREAGDWNATGLDAIHAVISAADALTSRFLKMRSRGQDHERTSELLRRLPIPGTVEGVQTFLEVVRLKDLVEYEDRMFGEQEAVATTKRAERFLKWVRDSLAKPES